MAKSPNQFELVFVPHTVEGQLVEQRATDGYVNATAMCRAAGRPWSRYWENPASKEFAKELASDLGIPITELIQSVSGGCAWAIQRKWETGDVRSFKLIEDRISYEYDLWKKGTKHYY